MSLDPLVQHWRETSRPLNWRPWRHLAPVEQARMRWLLMEELLLMDRVQADQRLGGFHWRHAHRELLELKAACGHAAQEGPCAVV